MRGISYIVRWKDKNGNENRKAYDDSVTARKAVDWLNDNGILDADIAITLPRKEVAQEEEATPAQYKDH